MFIDSRTATRCVLRLLLLPIIFCLPAGSYAQTTANIQGSWAGTAVTGSGDYELLFLTLGQTGTQVLGSFSFVDQNGVRRSSNVFGSVNGTTFTFASDPLLDSLGCGNQVTQGSASVSGTSIGGSVTVAVVSRPGCAQTAFLEFSLAKSASVYCGTYTGNPDAGVFSLEISAGGVASGFSLPTNGRGSPALLTGQLSGSTVNLTTVQGQTLTGTIQGGVLSGTGAKGSFTASTTGDQSTCSPGLPSYTVPNLGGIAASTAGSANALAVGYATIQPGSGSQAPSGLAIFGFRENSVLVTEAGVPASPAIQSGRIYAEVNGPVNTGLAIANRNNIPATISFSFTDKSGASAGSGTATVPANGQIAAFLNQAPFNGGNSVSGAFTFNSSVPVGVIALRGLTNERSEFLITTLPVVDLTAGTSQAAITFPHFADSGGWTTSVVLVNPTSSPLSGTILFRDPAGQNATVSINGVSSSSFAYSIAAQSSQKLQTSGSASAVVVGSIVVTPAASTITPSGVAIFSFRKSGITVTEAGVPTIQAGSAFRLYAEASGDFNNAAIGSIQTGFAISNTSSTAATVTLELENLDGSFTGLTGSVSIPGNGKTSLFMNQVQGLSSLPTPFQGILRVSSLAAISVVGLRGRYNERNDFLITTTPPTNEAGAGSTSQLYFPHFADSGGYTTQFILFSGLAGQASSGTFQMSSQSGQQLNLIIE